MSLTRAMLADHRGHMIATVAASAASAALSVTIIGFINARLLAAPAVTAGTLAEYAALLAALFAIGTASQVSVTTFGHRLVYRLRKTLVKRVLDTSVERLEALGAARILACLSGDTARITTALSMLPSVVYGLVLSLSSFGYLLWLSPRLFSATILWIALTVAVGVALLRRGLASMRKLRELDDRLVADYQTVIDGRNELALNRERARDVYERDVEGDVRAYRDLAIRVEAYGGVNDGWLNAMVLGAIGLCFFLAHGFGWAPGAVAVTYALTILFLRAPITTVATAVPVLMGGSVALRNVESLDLADHVEGFDAGAAPMPADFRAVHLESVAYRYPSAGGDDGFAVGPVSLTLRRGEVVFIIGGNGSGKSTLARLLTGLYRPHAGRIRVDDAVVDDASRAGYRRLFAAVFSDFHLFHRPVGPGGEAAAPSAVTHWLERLDMSRKVSLAGDGSIDTRVSQGQKKRLGLLHALVEERPILLLDEWAADQDPAFRRFFYTELLPSIRARGTTIVAITHDERYFEMADRVLKLESGALVDWIEPVTSPLRAEGE